MSIIINKAVLEDGQIKILKTKTMEQSDLTSDCWSIQMWGLEACQTCEFLNTSGCGGQNILAEIADGKRPNNSNFTVVRR